MIDRSDVEMMDIADIIDAANEAMEMKLRTLEGFSAECFGLDRRAGILYTDGNCIIVSQRDARLLDYYGGFEYVEPGSIATLGDYKIYLDTDDRVREALEEFDMRLEESLDN